MLLQKNWCLSRFLNLPKMLEKIYEFIHDEGLRLQKGSFGQELIENFNFLNYIYQLLDLLEHNYKR